MPFFRKKPVVIEAVQYNGDNWEDIALFTDHIALSHGTSLAIATLEGVMTAYPGDWIIKGVAGEFYPCKPSIFETIYDSVEYTD